MAVDVVPRRRWRVPELRMLPVYLILLQCICSRGKLDVPGSEPVTGPSREQIKFRQREGGERTTDTERVEEESVRRDQFSPAGRQPHLAIPDRMSPMVNVLGGKTVPHMVMARPACDETADVPTGAVTVPVAEDGRHQVPGADGGRHHEADRNPLFTKIVIRIEDDRNTLHRSLRDRVIALSRLANNYTSASAA